MRTWTCTTQAEFGHVTVRVHVAAFPFETNWDTFLFATEFADTFTY